jgi:putative peptide zinc metalloprotease protein
LFTVAAFCYRWIIMFSIILFLMKMLEPYNLESIGVGIALFSLGGMLGMPGYKLYKYMSVPGRMHQVKKVRFFVVLGSVLAALTLVLAVPLPQYLRCNLIVMPREIETVWVKESGQLMSCEVEPGEAVVPGQVLARLGNLDIELSLKRAEGEILEKQGALEMEVARLNSGSRPSLNDPTTALVAELAKLDSTFARLKKRAADLELKSSISGTVLATPYEQSGQASEETSEVDMRPLLYGQHSHISAQRGQRFCEIADLSQWYAVVVLTEDQVKFAKLDQPTKLKLYSEPGAVYRSKIESLGDTEISIVRQDYDVNQKSMSRLESRPPDPIVEMVAAYQQQDFQYFARVPLGKTELPLKIGLGGEARVFIGYRSLGNRLRWWFNQNFRS